MDFIYFLSSCASSTLIIYIYVFYLPPQRFETAKSQKRCYLSGSQKIMTQVCVRWSIDSRLVHVFTVRMFLARYIFKDSHGYILPFSWLPFTFLLVTVLTLPLRRYNLGDASLHLLVEVYVQCLHGTNFLLRLCISHGSFSHFNGSGLHFLAGLSQKVFFCQFFLCCFAFYFPVFFFRLFFLPWSFLLSSSLQLLLCPCHFQYLRFQFLAGQLLLVVL